jgi:hypothetical protein
MDIRVTSTGKEFFQVEPTVAALLREAFPESFALIEKRHPHERATTQVQAAVNASVVHFAVVKNAFNDRWQVVMSQGSYEEAFQGTPDLLITYGFGGKAQRHAPKEIVDRYRAAFDADTANNNARLAGR